MKLKHGSKFANQQGSTWRIIFVLALMPWLRRYRIQGGNADDFDEVRIGGINSK